MRKRFLQKSLSMFVATLMVFSCIAAILPFVIVAAEPAAEDTIVISHVNAYSWGAYYSQIIYGSGKTLASAYDTDYAYWYVFEVQKIDGVLTVTKAFGPGKAKDKTLVVPDDGFFLCVFSNADNLPSWNAAGNLAVGDTLVADFDYTVNKSSATPIGNLIIRRNYIGTNLIAGKAAEEADGTIISSGNNDNIILTDGEYADSGSCTSGKGLYYQKVHGETTWTTQTLIYDLGALKTIEGVRMQLFAKWGVWVPPEVRVYVSDNKTDWDLAKTVVPDGAGIDTTILTTRADFGAIGRYVKFEFDFRTESGSNMIGISELEVIGGDTFTVSGDIAYTAENLYKLIDGDYADDATAFSDERLVSFNWDDDFSYEENAENGTREFSIVYDLGEKKGITGIKLGAYKERVSFVDLPVKLEIYLSNDGSNFVHTSGNSPAWSSTVADLVASTDRGALKGACSFDGMWNTRAILNARFVKLVITLADPFLFLSEIEVVTAEGEGQEIDEVKYLGADVELPGEKVVIITSKTDGFDIQAVKGETDHPYKYVYNSNLTRAKWDAEKQAYVVTDNKVNPWPDGHTGVLEVADDEIIIAAQSSGALPAAGSGAKWVMWKLELGTELHIYDDVIAIGKTLAGQEQKKFYTTLDGFDTTGFTLVDGVNTGIWQTPDQDRPEFFYYKNYLENGKVVTEMLFKGPLTGTDASMGNGNGTNVRVWYFVPFAEKDGTAFTTYTHFIDVSWTPSGVKDRLLGNTNPTGNTASVMYGYDVSEKPYTVESVVPFLKDGLYVKVSMPLSALGGTDAVELMVSASNKLSDLGNNALYHTDYIQPWKEWKHDKAILLHPSYPNGVTQISDFEYLKGNEEDLTDGDKHTEYADWNGETMTDVLVFKNPDPKTQNGEIVLLYNLGSVNCLDGITLSLYRDYGVMIGTPKEFTISYGLNPIYFTEIDTYEVNDSGATNATHGVMDLKCDFGKYVWAQYIRISFKFSSNEWVYGTEPTDGKIYFEFVALTEITRNYTQPAVQPTTLVDRPAEAIVIDYAGYKHSAHVSIIAGDNLTVAELTARGNNGLAKDLNYAYNILVDKDNVVIATDFELSKPCTFVCPEGGYIISYNGNKAEYEVMANIKVGDVITLYNIDLTSFNNLQGVVELTNAGFTYVPYAEGVTQVSDFDYLRGNEDDLTDGNKHEEYGNWGNEVQNALVFQNPDPKTQNGTIELVYNLGAAGNYNRFTLSFYRDYAVMIGTPGSVKLEYSLDGRTFTEIDEFELKDTGATTATNGVIDLVCDFGLVKAQYFKISFQFGDDRWVYGDNPADGKIYFEFVALTEITATYAQPKVQPSTLVDRPAEAIVIDYAGYKHSAHVSIIAGDNLTVAELTARGNNGLAKDLNYAYNILVDKDNVVIATDFELSKPCTFVCPEGGYIITYNGNKAGYEVMANIKVGDVITLYNIDLTHFNDLLGVVELTNAGFTYATPGYAEGVTQVSEFDYLRGNEDDLTDGNKHEEYGNWGNEVQNALVFQNPDPKTQNGTIELVYNLGTAGDYNRFVLSFYRDYAVMIGIPGSVFLEYSANGVNWTSLGSYTLTDQGATTATNGVIDLVCDFEKVNAKYFKIYFQFGDDRWVYGDNPTDGKIYFEFVALTEIAAVNHQTFTPPDYDPANLTGDIGIMIIGSNMFEGVTTLITSGTYNMTWKVSALLEYDEAKKAYKVINTLPSSGASPNWTLAANQIVIASDIGNDWPTITANPKGDEWWYNGSNPFGTPYDECPNFNNAMNNAWYNTIRNMKVGDYYVLVGVDVSDPKVISNVPVDTTYDYIHKNDTYATYSYLKPYVEEDTRPEAPDISDYVTDGLVALYTAGYHSEDGKTWYDASGNKIDIDLSSVLGENNYWDNEKGVFVNKATKVFFDKAIADLISTGKFTTEMVIKNTDVLGTSFGTYINSTNDAYALFIRRSSPIYAEFKCYTYDRPKQEVSDKDYFANSTVTITYDATTGKCVMYVNGVALKSTTGVGVFSVADLFFGTEDDAKKHNTEFVGFRFYDRALSAEEVAANYAVDNPVEPTEPTKPAWPPAPVDGSAIGIMFVDPGSAYGEGMTVLITEPGTQSISWANAIVLAPDEATGYLKVTQVVLSSGTATDITIPEGGYAVITNIGNNYPALLASNPGKTEYEGKPNYISAHNEAWYNAVGAAKVDDLFVLFGTYYTNISDEQAYYEDGFETYYYLVKVAEGDITGEWDAAPENENGSVVILTPGYESFTVTDGKLIVNDETLRYQYFLVLTPAEGGGYTVKLVGNNIIPNDTNHPYTIEIGEDDIIVAFYYNSENTDNQDLYDIYLAALGEGNTVYNGAVTASGVVNVVVVGGQLRFTVVTDPGESSEEPSTVESSDPASESSGGGTSPTGDAGFIALGIIAVISLAGVMIVRKRK
ncbi:MAG: LamG-like jellyroll fold domain-containing protein [Eubacteriales bacterium]